MGNNTVMLALRPSLKTFIPVSGGLTLRKTGDVKPRFEFLTVCSIFS